MDRIDKIHNGITLNHCHNIVIRRTVISSLTNGLVSEYSDFTFENNTIVGELMGSSNDGIYMIGDGISTSVIRNNIIAWFYKGMHFENQAIVPSIQYNNIHCYTDYLGIPDQTGILGNIASHPEFRDIYCYDYSLGPNSPCIDAGDPTILDPDGSRSDMGAIPYIPRKIYVSTTGEDVPCFGTQISPYATIPFAFEQASWGDTIQLMMGRHHVSGAINLKSGITLKGEDPANTEIYFDFDPENDFDFSILKGIDVMDVTIEKLRIKTVDRVYDKTHNGITLNNCHNIVIRRTVISGLYNGLVSENSDFTFENNTVIGQMWGAGNDGIYMIGDGEPSFIRNNIIAWFYKGVYIGDPVTIPSIQYNNVYSYTNYLGIPDQTGILGNIAAHPEFTDIYSDDYSLMPNSPCIDAGDPTILDPNSSRSDMGAIPSTKTIAEVPSICAITLDELTGKLKLIWQAQQGILEHKVYRETTATNIFDMIGSTTDESGEYIDLEADPNERSYRYFITAVSTDQTETEPSGMHKSIHLTANVGLNDKVNLIWDAYYGFDYSSFNIYRGPSQDNITEHLATIPSNLFSYTDTDPSALNTYYQVEVVSNTSCSTVAGGRTSIDKPSSRSNTVNRNGAVTGLYDLPHRIEIYPNPTNGLLNVVMPSEYIGEIELELRDITGLLVKKLNGFAGTGFQLNTQGLNSGVFILSIKTEGSIVSNRRVMISQ